MRTRRFQFIVLGGLCLAFLSCEPPAPHYLQDGVDWEPTEMRWVSAPMPDAHRLSDHATAMSNRRVRTPEARRRAQAPERRAVPKSVRVRKKRGPPGMIKVTALRGKKDTDATVWVNGLKAGKAPMFIHLPSGSHRVELHSSAGEKQVKEIEVLPKSNQLVVFQFSEDNP